MVGILQIAASVATPLALLGLVAALAYFAYSRQLRFQEKKLEALPPDQRATRTDEYLTRYGIDGKKLPLKDKLALIRDEMDKRHRRSLGFVIIAAVVLVICFALAVVAFVVVGPRGEVAAGQERGPTRLPGREASDLIGASTFLRQNLNHFPGMQDAISHFVELAQKGGGKFFCSDPLDRNWTSPTATVKAVPRPPEAGTGGRTPKRTVEVYVFVPRSRSEPDLDGNTGEIARGIARVKLEGTAPKGSVVFAAYCVEGEDSAADFSELEVYLE